MLLAWYLVGTMSFSEEVAKIKQLIVGEGPILNRLELTMELLKELNMLQ